ncbi:MAG TPA: diguanylate cyclase [Bryobacteraceae bacterium]|nr:diguanylate cyclase [Bryobacteraceae bacterium]
MGENVTIAVIAPVQPDDFFDLLWQGVWEATFDLSSFGVEVQDLTTERKDVAEQRRMLEMLLNVSVDAIALFPAHSSALDDLIDQHTRQGTAVVTFHADAPQSRRAAFVGPDPNQTGALAAEVLVKLMGGRGRILSFPGSLDQSHLAGRYNGFRSALARYGGRIEETAYWSKTGDADEITPELLASFGTIAGYYAGNEDLARIASAIEEAGLYAPCLGFANTEQVRPFLERGAVSAVIDENRYQLGYFAVQKAYEVVLKRESGAAVPGVQIPSSVVFAANASASGDSLRTAFELLVRQRTEILLSYKQRLEEANAKLLDLAVTDPLTGLYNRRKFEEVINMEILRARRWGPLSLLMIDLNCFKMVNDRYGHATGDDVLKGVARVLQSCCRVTDTCARLGGDEFAVILPRADYPSAEIVRNRIQQQIAVTTIPSEAGELHVSLSIGIAAMPDHGTNAAALLAAADAAMYQAKQNSRSERDFSAIPQPASGKANKRPAAFP